MSLGDFFGYVDHLLTNTIAKDKNTADIKLHKATFLSASETVCTWCADCWSGFVVPMFPVGGTDFVEPSVGGTEDTVAVCAIVAVCATVAFGSAVTVALAVAVSPVLAVEFVVVVAVEFVTAVLVVLPTTVPVVAGSATAMVPLMPFAQWPVRVQRYSMFATAVKV